MTKKLFTCSDCRGQFTLEQGTLYYEGLAFQYFLCGCAWRKAVEDANA